MLNSERKKKRIVMLPDSIITKRYVGDLFGNYFETTGIFNIFSEEMVSAFDSIAKVGKIVDNASAASDENELIGRWNGDIAEFSYKKQSFETKQYSLVQNVFSRNTGILETSVMSGKCAFILGCGSVGSLIALELARTGVGKFVLIDNDVLEYHNLCRHQCSIQDVGDYKVFSLARRIKEINPTAVIECVPKIVENVGKEIFEQYCVRGEALLAGCADNRAADVYANSIAIAYGVPFVSVGFWERAFAGEIFYHLPDSDMPCYKCSLGDGGGLSQRQSTNRRFYTNEEDLTKINFEPGISVDINFVTLIGVKLILDIFNIGNEKFTPRLLGYLQQYTLVCNTNKPEIGGEMAEIFSYPLQVTTSFKVNYGNECPPCKFDQKRP